MSKLWRIEIHQDPDEIIDKKFMNENTIELYELGTFVGVTASFHDMEGRLHKSLGTNNLINVLKKSKIKDAKIYRFPHLSLPRDKVNIINDKYGSKIIRDREKCDIAVISDTLINKFQSHTWDSVTFNSKKELLAGMFNEEIHNLSSVFNPYGLEKIKTFISKINDDDKIIISIKHHYYAKSNRFTPGCEAELWIKKIPVRQSGYTIYIAASEDENYQWICDNIDKLCFDTELNDLATEDSVILTEDSFKTLNKMIDSSADISMALETMANCNVEKSRTFLGILLFFKWEKMKVSKNWNHVNFKALRAQFVNYTTYHGYHRATGYDELIKLLIKDNALTEYAVKVIAKKMFQSVLVSTFGVEANGVFKIDPSVLELKSEYKDKIIGAKTFKQLANSQDLPF